MCASPELFRNQKREFLRILLVSEIKRKQSEPVQSLSGSVLSTEARKRKIAAKTRASFRLCCSGGRNPAGGGSVIFAAVSIIKGGVIFKSAAKTGVCDGQAG